MKKGQCAMEFLMTYGWAILVVLVCIGALAYFGVFDRDRLTPDKCFCRYTSMEDSFSQTIINSTLYIECINTTRYVDFEEKKIKFDAVRKLFYCSENKTLIPLE